MKKLYKSKFNKMIAGVCGGLGIYFNIDPTILRLIMVFVCIFTGIFPLLLAYFIAALIIPKEYTKIPLKPRYSTLLRSKTDKKIAGICGGFARMLKIDSTLVRFIMIILCFVTGIVPLIFAYIIGWIIIPKEI